MRAMDGRHGSYRFCNDSVLAYGAIPVELIRAGMLDLPLTREIRASWNSLVTRLLCLRTCLGSEQA